MASRIKPTDPRSVFIENYIIREIQKITDMYRELVLHGQKTLYLNFLKRSTWNFIQETRTNLSQHDLKTCKQIIFNYFEDLPEAYHFFFILRFHAAWMEELKNIKDKKNEVALKEPAPQLYDMGKGARTELICEYFQFSNAWQPRSGHSRVANNRAARFYFEDLKKETADFPNRDMSQLQKDAYENFWTLPASDREEYIQKSREVDEVFNKEHEWILSTASVINIAHPLGPFRVFKSSKFRATMFNDNLLNGLYAEQKQFHLTEHLRILVPDVLLNEISNHQAAEETNN